MMGNLSPSAANMNFNANFLNQQMQRGGSVLLVSNLSEEVRNKFKLPNCFIYFLGGFISPELLRHLSWRALQQYLTIKSH